MYLIELTEFGIRLTFEGQVSAPEMAAWYRESKAALPGLPRPFYVFIDMRTMIPLDREAQVHIEAGQTLYRLTGMERSVVIFQSPVTAAQFRRIGGETGIARNERYIDATTFHNWEEVGLDWLLNRVEPDSWLLDSKKAIGAEF